MAKPTASPVNPRSATIDQVFHVADFLNRYPGEEVVFQTTLKVATRQAGRTLTVQLPVGTGLAGYTLPDGQMIRSSAVRDLEEGPAVDWTLGDDLAPGGVLSFITRASVLPLEQELPRRSQAVLRDSQGYPLCSESVELNVRSQSRLLSYLPEIYHDSEFLGRFLMLFESFLNPVERQIAQSEGYYDPDLAPESFLPWLASWIGVAWDDSLPVSRQRRLLSSALELYQRRGTQAALREYLEIYSGGEVEIGEHRAQNFSLGKEFHLGATIALGKTNFPHTFSVRLKVGRAALAERFGKSQVNAEALFRKKIEAIIEAQKPAHTAFGLELQVFE
jgi:phage tail-like protein